MGYAAILLPHSLAGYPFCTGHLDFTYHDQMLHLSNSLQEVPAVERRRAMQAPLAGTCGQGNLFIRA